MFTGILPVSKNDDGLATVMGHGEFGMALFSSSDYIMRLKCLNPSCLAIPEIAHQGMTSPHCESAHSCLPFQADENVTLYCPTLETPF